jgi:pimeloyl-ACP methyl ester carboxylesterase
VLVGPFDVLGIHVGAVEALEIAHLVPAKVRRVVMVGVPLFTPGEQQRQMEKYSEQPLKPAAEGGHVLAAWRSGFAFRQPPYDLADVHRRFVEQLLAASPGAASKAAGSYPLEKKLKTVKVPLTVFAPHDDLIEQTARVKALLKPDSTYVDLPAITQDPFHVAVDRMAELVNRYLPA